MVENTIVGEKKKKYRFLTKEYVLCYHPKKTNTTDWVSLVPLSVIFSIQVWLSATYETKKDIWADI